MEIEKNLPESQEGFLQELGTPKEFLSLLHGLATVFVSRPVLFLAIFAAVENIARIAKLVLGRVLAARAFSRCFFAAACAFCWLGSHLGLGFRMFVAHDTVCRKSTKEDASSVWKELLYSE